MKLQYIPINEKKVPMVSAWQTSNATHDLTKGAGVGIVCGKLSDNIEAIDFDMKYDITGTLFARYKKEVLRLAPGLLEKMTVQKTVNKGFHFLYRCETIEGNLKLANRYATETEAIKGEKVKVLIETRGEGGYVAVYPTKGYELVYGTFDTISQISEQERLLLHEVARTFNEVFKEVTHKKIERKTIKGQTPFEDYNHRGDVIALLEKHGWKVCGQKGDKTLLKRPGDTSALHSGNFDAHKNWFSVFSTSTEFEPEKAYLPYAVYAMLECKGDYSDASKRLYDEGYGDRKEENKNEVKIATRIDEISDDYSFIANESDYSDYINSWRNGTFKKGTTTGFSQLDNFFVHKEHTLVIANGLDNVGKSTVLWYLALLNTIFTPGDKWIIVSAENSVGTVVRKLAEFYWCEPIQKMSDEKYLIAKQHINKHFAIIKSDDALFNYKDILAIAKKSLKKDNYNRLLIDPYNALVIDIPENSKLNTHEYHYQAISEIKQFTKQNDISIYINAHVVTAATRLENGVKFIKAPKKGDTEGGSKFPNKTDDFLTIHRHVEDPENFMWTEIFVRKVKETETGGRVTFHDTPFRMRAVIGLCGFEDENGFNPILSYHGMKPVELPLPKLQAVESFYHPNEFDLPTEPSNEPLPF